VSADSDERLIQRFAAGEVEAFSVVYRRHKDTLYAFLVRQVSPQLADELFQDVWTSVIENVSGFRHDSSFRTWLFSIARNRVVDHLRTRKQPISIQQSQEDDPGYPGTRTSDVTTLESSGEAALIRQQARSQVRLCLEKLPCLQREAVLLKESGFSVKELADIANVGFETAKSRLKLAYKLLRGCLEVHRESA
jgi:RNA polymerase sigma-70 factor (ECF subfamily)